jgi:hypothetical protein
MHVLVLVQLLQGREHLQRVAEDEFSWLEGLGSRRQEKRRVGLGVLLEQSRHVSEPPVLQLLQDGRFLFGLRSCVELEHHARLVVDRVDLARHSMAEETRVRVFRERICTGAEEGV